jgi:hypothetical protein
MKLNWFQVFSRTNTGESIRRRSCATDLAALLDADLYIIAVSDDAIISRCNVAFKTD